ncbi:formyltetrahydrofolate deformylase [Marinobacter persicus]|jgi:formyltetrahydrofolate deformylase|uniref:Formyltetrahydrofolate deformylase n=1 Tax=Marinobacter persicus TaxID=930118 RepID=A0A2S6G4E4_9GAMM|nr:formyltetrahydrofolate deformylase [Marinobacter persicus]PPK50569.1 formyltetrahydrofolate deformylase [Marinobacter persicus]PPK53844.1 formyltetrahydrofolate deformylase [Marinobacter persicus]PPK57080.1 formyltetrahydrofolate deformylase [Marinobacter persicus]
MEHTYRLVISCPDRVGIVAKVSNFLSTYNGWITEASHHSDTQSGWFFMRHEIKAESIPFGLEQFRTAFEPIAREFNMSWHIADSAQPKRVILMCSKESHCLADLLYRWHSKDLNAEIVAVISNHDDLRRMVEWHDIPYHHIPVSKENKAEAFRHIEELFEHYETDVVVLARYMQILPEALCDKYAGKVINIHHSFLPSFAGARPYHQAYSRGVKLIGATCHYVTQDLDEGPIIEQDVIRISHSDSIDDMVRLGKDVEKNVLARGLRAHIEDRVITYENKTVVFD